MEVVDVPVFGTAKCGLKRAVLGILRDRGVPEQFLDGGSRLGFKNDVFAGAGDQVRADAVDGAVGDAAI